MFIVLLFIASAAAVSSNTVQFTGTCDASGAVPLDGSRFIVGDDENNILRVYDAVKGGSPLSSTDLSPMLGLVGKKKPPEADIEAAAKVGDVVFWLTSHGRNSSGKRLPSRFLFFATDAVSDAIRVVGTPYRQLLEDLVAHPPLKRFRLEAAAELPPKAEGGLNLEGLTAMADGQGVLIGFRSPVPEGKALLVPLLNPKAVVQGEAIRLGEPILIDLGGRGVRALLFWNGGYLIAASELNDAPALLYRWEEPNSDPAPVAGVSLLGLNPEALAAFPGRKDILVVSDDGTQEIDGKDCKRLKDSQRKRFRGMWISIPAKAP